MRLSSGLIGLVWLVLVMGCVGLGCSSDDTETKISEIEQAREDSLTRVAAEEDLLRTVSARLIGRFSEELKGRLSESIRNFDHSGAVGECQLAAPTIASSLSNELLSIRRVTDKYRNPDNRATLAERDIMAVFNDTIVPKRTFYGDWKTEDSVRTYCYYKPIFIRKLCLNCHGDMQTLAPGVYQAVKKHFPTDKATGYKLGDLRGMFAVEIQWPEGKDLVAKIITGEAFVQNPDSSETGLLEADSLETDSLEADSLETDSLEADSLEADSLDADSSEVDSL